MSGFAEVAKPDSPDYNALHTKAFVNIKMFMFLHYQVIWYRS